MKKLLSIFAACLLALACGVAFTACFGNSNDRKGEKCYVDVVNYNTGEKYAKEIYIEYATEFNGTSNWIGTDGDSERYWFIKGDVVNFRVFCNSPYYYLDHDFKLVINDELVDMEEKQGYLFDGVDRLCTYFEGSYTIQSDITVACSEIKERTANIALKALSDDEMWENYLNTLPEGVEPGCTKAQYLQDQKRDFFDDSVKVRFEDKDVFHLEKDTWGISELRDYIIANNVTGTVGAGTGTNFYVFTEGYTQKVSMGFDDNRAMEATVLTDRYCYVNEQANEYGYKVTLRPFATENSDKYGAVDMSGEVKFKDGYVMLQIKKEGWIRPEVYGSIMNLDYVGYRFGTDIDEVPLDNSIFSIKYGNGAYGENLNMSDFNSDGKINVQIRLNKYSDAEWKNLYDRMKINISDKNISFTISQNGTINLVLDRPYKYFDLAIHGDVPEYYSGETLGEYMYTYYWYFDIIDIAKNAGLVIPVDWSYYNPNWLTISFGGTKYNEDCGLYNNMVARIINENHGNIKALMVKDDDMIGFAGDKENYGKVEITDQNNRKFVINVITKTFSADEAPSYGTIINQLKSTAYTDGKEAVVFKMVYESEDNGETRYSYDYYIKVLAGLNVKGIRFYN